jgi:hypothetical protein
MGEVKTDGQSKAMGTRARPYNEVALGMRQNDKSGSCAGPLKSAAQPLVDAIRLFMEDFAVMKAYAVRASEGS